MRGEGPTVELSRLAINDILEQADWYELQSGEQLATMAKGGDFHIVAHH